MSGARNIMNKTISTTLISGAAFGLSLSVLAETPANISGSWKIDSQNGPTPICAFEQVGDNLTGSCIGPNAKGTITGTIIGTQVRWRWQWVTYAGNSSGAFDFTGTLRPDNTVTGLLSRQTGLSLNFTARRQSTAPATAQQSPAQQTSQARQIQKYQPPLTAQQIAHPSNFYEQHEAALATYDNDLVTVARARFKDMNAQLQWLGQAQQQRDANDINRTKPLVYPVR